MKKAVVIFLAGILLISGCTAEKERETDKEPRTPDEESVLFVFSPDNSSLSKEEKEAYAIVDGAIEKAYGFLNRVYGKDGMHGSAAEILHSDIKALPDSHVSFYEKADPEVREAYDEMLEAVRDVKPYSFNGDDKENGWNILLTAEYALRMDHPEYSLYHSADFEDGSMVPSYYPANDTDKKNQGSKEEMLAALNRYRLAEQRIVDNVPKEASDVQKYLYFAAVLCYQSRYDHSLKSRDDPFQAYDCLIVGNSICQAYAECFLRLCRKEGMDCTNINNDEHIWSCVKTEEGTYYIDVTFMDQDAEKEENEISLLYFLMDETFMKSRGDYRDGKEYDE